MSRLGWCLGILVVGGVAALHGESGVSVASARSVALPPATPVRIRLDVGTLTVTGSARPDVAVRIVRHAPDAEALRTLEEHVAVTPDGLEVTVVPRGRTHDATLSSTVVVELPAAQPVADLQLFEGPLRLAGLSGPLRATVTRGSIEASELSGDVRLETVMGPISVRRGQHPLDAPLRLRTFNGDINLSLPSPLPNARILALALNGTVTSTLPLTTRTTVGPRFSEATFGSGNPVVTLEVVNGHIRITGATP